MKPLHTVCMLTDESIRVVVIESNGRNDDVFARSQLEYTLPDSLFVDFDPESLSETIFQSLQSIEKDMVAIDLVIPLHWCFTHTLENPHKKFNEESLSYCFEQYLPLPLEELTCAYQPCANGLVLAAAVPTTPMAELMTMLSNKGIEVRRILIDGLVAMQSAETDEESTGVLLVDHRWARSHPSAHSLEQNGTVIVGVDENSSSLINLIEKIEQRIPVQNQPYEWTVFDLADRYLEYKNESIDHVISLHSSQESFDSLTISAVATLSTLDLRTGPLAGNGRWQSTLRLVQQCLVCLLFIVVISMVGLQVHTNTLQQHLAVISGARLEVYQQVFDVDRLPPGAAVRLASEKIRLEGLTRTANTKKSKTTKTMQLPLDVLRDWVASIPMDVRIMLNDARIENARFHLRGQTASHRDAERIAEAMKSLVGLNTRPPRTSRLQNGGVEFSITASRYDN